MTDIILTPANDLQQSFKAAKPGDRILLKAGVYRNADWDKPFPHSIQFLGLLEHFGRLKV